jgi:hypothetical protein
MRIDINRLATDFAPRGINLMEYISMLAQQRKPQITVAEQLKVKERIGGFLKMVGSDRRFYLNNGGEISNYDIAVVYEIIKQAVREAR